MQDAVIWGLGHDYNQYINCIKLQEELGELRIIGVTDSEEMYSHLDGYPFISAHKLDVNKEKTYVIITSREYFDEIRRKVKELGFDGDYIVPARVFAIPCFRFSKYIKLIDSHVSIIADNCWGGLASNYLGLPFLSPFVNMFVPDDDYLTLLRDLRGNLEKKVHFKKMAYNEILQRDYPVCMLGNVELCFNHYTNMESVEEKWYSRLGRINWNNLFIMMYTDRLEIARQFDALDYPKKICFVPFECELESSYTLRMAGKMNLPFWDVVNKTASGYLADYDLIELLTIGEVLRR